MENSKNYLPYVRCVLRKITKIGESIAGKKVLPEK